MNIYLQTEISRNTAAYWLNGGGAWMSLWDGTGRDMWLMLAHLLASFWLGFEHFRYAAQLLLPQENKVAVTKASSRHRAGLATLFFLHGAAMLLSPLVMWFCALYWFAVLGAVLTAITARYLNAALLSLRVVQEIEAERVLRQQESQAATLALPSLAEGDTQLSLSDHAARLRSLAGCSR